MLGEPDKSVLTKMTEYLHHRGPDGNGIFLDESCGFAHTRLAIVDVAGSPQPIFGQGKVAIVNGEIYNYKSLRDSSYDYQTNGDSEIVLSLHTGRGSASDHAKWVSKLDGMFAFALWSENQLILARDSMGIKPLMRTLVENSMLFSSEAKALRAHDSYKPAIDDLALRARIAWEYPLDATTLFEGVHQVRPGTVEVWELIDGKPKLTSSARFEAQSVAPEKEWSDAEGVAGVVYTQCF